MGRALREIRDSRLYRRTHSTFEAYLADRCGLRKTSGYELIDGATAYELAQPIAAKLNMRFTAAAQLRPLVKVESKTEMQDVLRRAAKKIEPDRHGDKVPTMVGLEEAVRDSTATVDYTPEQLRKDAQQRRWDEAERQRQAHQRQGIPVDDAELPGQTHFFQEPSPGMFGRGPESVATKRLGMFEEDPTGTREELRLIQSDQHEPLEEAMKKATYSVAFDNKQRRNTLADVAGWKEWLEILRGPKPSDGSDPGYWNGQPNPHARQLSGIAHILRRLADWQQPGPPGVEGTGSSPRKDLATLLHSLAAEIPANQRCCTV